MARMRFISGAVLTLLVVVGAQSQQAADWRPIFKSSSGEVQGRLNEAVKSQAELQTKLAAQPSVTEVADLRKKLADAEQQAARLKEVQAELQTRLAEQAAAISRMQVDLSQKASSSDVKKEVDSATSQKSLAALARIDALQKKYEQDAAAYDEAPGEIEVRRSIVDPKHVSDVFGKRIGKRFIAFQVTIINRRKDLQLRVQDLSLDLCKLFVQLAGKQISSTADPVEKSQAAGDAETVLSQGYCVASSQELALLRGVAEKGQSLDPRNLTLHILQGAGSILGAVAPASVATPATKGAAATVSTMFSKAVSVFAGPGIAAYNTIFPDYSVTQAQRLSDSAYAANTIVPQEQSKSWLHFFPNRYSKS